MPVSDYTNGNSDPFGGGVASHPVELETRVQQIDSSRVVPGFLKYNYFQSSRVNVDKRRTPLQNVSRRPI